MTAATGREESHILSVDSRNGNSSQPGKIAGRPAIKLSPPARQAGRGRRRVVVPF
ncbi:MAG: hypothetical protein KF777_07955 [Planctomycetaceae bacterium]|nr:hypothetical protein [Planctomycetaceae bacterium]